MAPDIEMDLSELKYHFSAIAFDTNLGPGGLYQEIVEFNRSYDLLTKKIEELSALCDEQASNIEYLQERVDFLEMDEKKRNARAHLEENLDELPFPDPPITSQTTVNYFRKSKDSFLDL